MENVDLPPHWLAFIEDQLRSRRFNTPGEVVAAGLRLLEAQTADDDRIIAALIEAEESGPAQPFDRTAFFSEMHAREAARHRVK